MAKKTTKTRSKVNIQHNIWFKQVRGSYLPVKWEGWLLYLPFTAYLVSATIYGFSDNKSGLETIMFVVPNWVAATAIMTWIAKHTSK